MICSNCGFQNNSTSKFCMKCGQAIAQPTPVSTFGNTTNEFVASQPVQPQPVQSTQTYQTQSSGSLNYIFFILAVILKPITSIKEEINKFNDTKTSIIFALMVSGATTIINLVKTIFAVVMVKSYDWSTGKTVTNWTWDNLKNLKWGEVIFKNFLIYAGILLAIALVYYLASLIIKKNASFPKLLGLASISIIPIVLCSLVIAPVLGKIYAPLGIIVTVIGAVYTVILLLDSVNRELALEDNDTKIYTNLVCLSILGSIGYYIFMKFFFAATIGLGDLENLLDLFK